MHKFSVTRKSLLFMLVFIVCASELFVSAEKFTVSKDKPKATAVVSSKNFKVKIVTGSADSYLSKKIELIVGGCNLSINTKVTKEKSGDQVQFGVTDPSGTSTNSNGPESFAVSKDGIDFKPKDSEKLFCTKAGAIKFVDYPGDKSKFLITVELKGIDPTTFDLPLVLSSDDELYDDAAAAKNGENGGSSLQPWQIAAIIAGAVIFLILIILAVVGLIVFLVCRRRKQKQQPQAASVQMSDVKTARSPEDGAVSCSKPMEEVKEEGSKKENKKKKEAKKRKKPSNVSEEDKQTSQADPPKPPLRYPGTVEDSDRQKPSVRAPQESVIDPVDNYTEFKKFSQKLPPASEKEEPKESVREAKPKKKSVKGKSRK